MKSLEFSDLDPGQAPLDWNTRMKIAVGSAKGLEYLHCKANPPVIYRDLKSANILLDNDFNPKLSDFGLAKLGPVGDNTHVSTRVMGTYGYCAPEYAMSGKLTLKSDIYSFGVVLMELITGRKAIDTTRKQGDQNLVAWVSRILSLYYSLYYLLHVFLVQLRISSFRSAEYCCGFIVSSVPEGQKEVCTIGRSSIRRELPHSLSASRDRYHGNVPPGPTNLPSSHRRYSHRSRIPRHPKHRHRKSETCPGHSLAQNQPVALAQQNREYLQERGQDYETHFMAVLFLFLSGVLTSYKMYISSYSYSFCSFFGVYAFGSGLRAFCRSCVVYT